MNIYVGNLNYKVDESTLEQTFAEYGTVDSAKIIIDKMSDRSKGFGFIEMSDDDDAQRAIDSLHESEFMGRKMIVNQSKPKD